MFGIKYTKMETPKINSVFTLLWLGLVFQISLIGIVGDFGDIIIIFIEGKLSGSWK